MPIGVTEEHVALGEAVAGWAERHCPPAVPRALLDAPSESLPPFWAELAAQGWLGLHVDEAHGGSGYGVPELAVVLEELGRVLAPGPFLPTTLAAAALQRGGSDAAAKALLPGLVAGDSVGAVAVGAGAFDGEPTADGVRVAGTVRPVLGAHLATILIAPVRVGGAEVWCALDAADCAIRELPSVDTTRRVAEVTVDGAVVAPERQLPALDSARVQDLAAALVAAELVGVAQWCVDDRRRVRQGARAVRPPDRPVPGREAPLRRHARPRPSSPAPRRGTRRARSTTPTTARRSRPRRRPSLAIDAAFANAKDCIQVLGGIGFTWEHDAHIYLQRAMTHAAACSGRRRRGACGARASSRSRGARRRLAVDLRSGGRRAPRRAARLPRRRSRTSTRPRSGARIAEAGLHRAARGRARGGGARRRVEQLVIDEEFRGREGAPARTSRSAPGRCPPLIVYGTDEQQAAVDPADAARRDQLVPAVQRARRGLRPRRR